MMKKLWSKSTLSALLIVIMLVVTACGGSGGSSSGSSTGGGSQSSGSTSSGGGSSTGSSGSSGGGGSEPAPVKVALIVPLSGPYAENGQTVMEGVEMAVEEINEAGGIQSLGGAKLEIIPADSGSADPGQAANVTRRVLQQNSDLTAVIGIWASAFTVAASTVTEQAKIPMLTQSFTDEITTRGYEYIFQFPAKSSQMGAASVDNLVKVAENAGIQLNNVALVSDNASASKTAAEAIVKELKARGITISEELYFQPGITDATSIATRVVNAKPDLVFLGGSLSDASLMIKTMRGMNYKGAFMGNGGAFINRQFAKVTGEDGNGTISVAGWNWDFPYPGAAEFNEKYTKKYNQDFAPQDAGTNYAIVYALKEALEKAGSRDPQKVRDAIAELDIPSIMTGGRVAFDETGMNKYVHPVLIQWLDGVPRTVYPESIRTVEPVFKLE